MKRRTLTLGTALVAVASVIAASTNTPMSLAAGTGNGSSSAQAIWVNPTSPLTVTTSSTNGLSTGGLNTLASDLTQLPTAMLSSLTSAVTGLTGASATNPSVSQPRPAAGSFPASCTSQGWTTSDCFNTSPASTVNVPSTASLALGLLQGYATADSGGYVAGAGTATTDLTLLGGLLDLGNLGTATSLAQCSAGASPVCAAQEGLSGTSLLGGQVRATVAQSGSNSLLSAQLLQGGSWVNVGSAAVPVGSTGTTVAVNNNLLTVSTSLTLSQLLGLFGGLPGLVAMTLSGLLSGVAGVLGLLLGQIFVDPKTTVGLTVTLGPGQTLVSGTSATAYGLSVVAALSSTVVLDACPALTVQLNGSLCQNALGVRVSPVGTLTTTTGGTLLNLDLAYSAATAGSAVATWIAPNAI